MAKIQFCLTGKTLVELCRECPEVVAAAIERNNMESAPSTDVQQLKAEIRAIADGLEISYRTADPMAVDNVVNELRVLSAV